MKNLPTREHICRPLESSETSTWLKPTIMDSVINLPGYTVLRKDLASDNHGGVYLYIRNDYLMHTQLRDLACCSDHEIMWVQLRPKRLPRGFSSLTVAVAYHPHWSGTENDLITLIVLSLWQVI